MNLFSGCIIYLIIWWVVIFAVLPWGVKPRKQKEIGADPGAPRHPKLKLKMLITTLISAVLWCVAYYLMEIKLIPLDL